MRRLLYIFLLLLPFALKAQVPMPYDTVRYPGFGAAFTPSVVTSMFQGVSLPYFRRGTSSVYDLGVTGKYLRTYYKPKAYIDSLSALKAPIPNGLVSNIPTSVNSIVVLGDSFMGGTGATTYQNGLGWILPRSILNAVDKGFPLDRGQGYHTFINMYNLFYANFGASTNGSFINAGISSSRLVLTAGQKVSITNVAINYADIIYNATNSTGTLQIKINGSVVKTRTLSGTGLQNTFDGSMITPVAVVTSTTDTISITSTGTVEIAGLEFQKNSYNTPFIYVSSQGGTSIQDYNTTAALDEIAFYLNTPAAVTTANKFMAIALGTNTLYYAPKSLTPSAYITALQTFITGINSRATNVQYIITVPAKANEAAFPIIAAGYTYNDYVKAIVEFATANKHTLIRYDLTPMGTGNPAYLADNEHPNDAGYLMLASAWGNALGIRPNSSMPLELINFKTQSAWIDATSSIQGQLNGKQATLVSGTNIKTINSATVLGSGNILLQTPLVAGTDYLPVTNPNFTGTLSGPVGSFNDGTQGLIVRGYTGGANNGAIYKYGVTPSNTNFLFASDGTTTVLNAATTVNLSVGASPVGSIAAGGISVSIAPTSVNHLTNKAYVDAAVAGAISGVVAFNDLSSQSGNITVTSYTVGASNGTFRVGGYIDVLSISTGSDIMTVSWTDQANTTHTGYFYKQGATVQGQSIVETTTFPTIDLRAKAATVITVSVTSASGTYNTGATIQKLR